jgi:protein translocase SecG subunit
MDKIILIAQTIVSIILVVLILLDQRGSALGGAFGGSGESFYSARRGLQQKIFLGIIISGSLFIILSIINLAI